MAWPSLNFWAILIKFKERLGADLENDHAPKFRGVKCKYAPHHADQWVKTPQIHI
jgi:hypothetical protein